MSSFRPPGGNNVEDYANETISSHEVLKSIGRMFYITDPSETSFPNLSSLPKTGYITDSLPYFFIMICLEWAILLFKGKPARLNDGLLNFAHGLMMNLVEIFFGGITFSCYIYLHSNFCVYNLPWDSTVTWIIAAFGVDFFYYWAHRFAHEIHFLWAAHQVHHSSEDYNLTTALRQSMFQGLGLWPFYLPMAFFIPPTHVVIHKELNLCYQFWIHTEVVKSIGPLEWVLNTASHHRVHHGANRYCLDKNYGGVLIIWDRIFGTFAEERNDPKIVYGLVDQPQFWNPITHQVFYYYKVWEKACSMPAWSDFFKSFVMGPGWFPGTPRLGDITFVKENPVRERYNPKYSSLLNIYTLTHFFLALIASDVTVRTSNTMPQLSCLLTITYILWTLTDIGLLYESSSWAWPSELVRCSVSLIMIKTISNLYIIPPMMIQLIFSSSIFVAIPMLGMKHVSNIKQD